MFRQPGTVPTLYDLSNWLRYEAWCHDFDVEISLLRVPDQQTSRSGQSKKTVAILHGVGEAKNVTSLSLQKGITPSTKPVDVKRFCDNTEHYLSQCKAFAKLTTDQAKDWIRVNKCWRSARTNHAAQCDLKKPCVSRQTPPPSSQCKCQILSRVHNQC